MTAQQKKEYFDYLDRLRDSGATNMFGAGAYLKIMFDLNSGEANEVLKKWMESKGQPKE
jgi:hypothetical protein